MLIRVLVALVLAFAASGVRADIGTIDNVPAATLLMPYFEVQPGNPNGVTTVITLHNSSASAAVARVTLWTDLGLPTAAFNLYLTGFDSEIINLSRVFNRLVPFTADAGDDPGDTQNPNDGFSNKGPLSQDINFPGIGNGSASQLGDSISPSLLAAHTGGLSDEYFGGQCGARNLGDGIARGYVTIDSMVTQTQDTHVDPGKVYFTQIDTRNILVGDYVIVNQATREVSADIAVPIEASPMSIGTRTFYGRFVADDGSDRREPLPTAWAGRASAGRTDTIYWRDPGVPVTPFACGGGPVLPSGQFRITLVNATGLNASNPTGNPFPFVAGVTTGATLGINMPLGWLFANLNLSDGTIRPSWLLYRQTPIGAPPGSGPTYLVPGVQLGQGFTGGNPVIP
jgi:hypothetical protein